MEREHDIVSDLTLTENSAGNNPNFVRAKRPVFEMTYGPLRITIHTTQGLIGLAIVAVAVVTVLILAAGPVVAG